MTNQTLAKERREIRKKRAKLNRTAPLHIMLIPAVALTFLFAYLPLGSLVMAFQNFKPLLGFTNPSGSDLINLPIFFRFPASGLHFAILLLSHSAKLFSTFLCR